MNTTRLALLGTVSDLHRELIRYDLACLKGLVATLEPDLLCAEATRENWESGDVIRTPIELREALAPLVAETDIVLVPVAASLSRYEEILPASGWRRSLAHLLHGLLRWGSRRADGPEGINGLAFRVFCHSVCWLTERTWTPAERAAWEQEDTALAANILDAVSRDPGRRFLVAVQCQRVHRVFTYLRAEGHNLEIVDYCHL